MQQKQASQYCLLYHYEKIQGTTTDAGEIIIENAIIPLRENTGNYNEEIARQIAKRIIPLRENTGNYNYIWQK